MNGYWDDEEKNAQELRDAAEQERTRSLIARLGEAASSWTGNKDSADFYRGLERSAQEDQAKVRTAQQDRLRDYLAKRKAERETVLQGREDALYDRKTNPQHAYNVTARKLYDRQRRELGVPDDQWNQVTAEEVQGLFGKLGGKDASQWQVKNIQVGNQSVIGRVNPATGEVEPLMLGGKPVPMGYAYQIDPLTGTATSKSTGETVDIGSDIQRTGQDLRDTRIEQKGKESQSSALGSQLGTSQGKALVSLKESKAGLEYMKNTFAPEMTQLFAAANAQGWTGPLAGRVGAMASNLGFQGSADAEQLRLAMKNEVIEHIKRISGAAATDAERANIEQLFASTNNTPELFTTRMNELIRRAERRVQQAEEYAKQYGLPPEQAMSKVLERDAKSTLDPATADRIRRQNEQAIKLLLTNPDHPQAPQIRDKIQKNKLLLGE